MPTSYDRLIRNLQKAAKGVGTVQRSDVDTSFQLMRRSYRPDEARKVRMQLVKVDGVLEWEEVTGAPRRRVRFRGRGAAPSAAGEAIAEFQFDRLPPSQITSFLANRDLKLTPKRNLRRWDARSKTLKTAKVPKVGKALILIHGTFSNGDNLVRGLSETPEGAQFLDDAVARYKGQVYVFDHPTLSVGPILNAMDVHSLFESVKSKTVLDVVSHSRGGLVTRWWFEHFDPSARRCRRAVLVGSPLAGTGLAAPPNIRNTIKLLTNIGDVIETVAGWTKLAVPIFAVVETLMTIVTSVGSFTAKTPLVDALIAMVPGLFSQSRVGNNPELQRLMESKPVGTDRYYAIASNFEPSDPGWAFWRRFRKDRLLDLGADYIFDGANDLVVDTYSMQTLANKLALPPNRLHDFGTSPTVHHLNYFQQPETIEFLRDSLW